MGDERLVSDGSTVFLVSMHAMDFIFSEHFAFGPKKYGVEQIKGSGEGSNAMEYLGMLNHYKWPSCVSSDCSHISAKPSRYGSYSLAVFSSDLKLHLNTFLLRVLLIGDDPFVPLRTRFLRT